MAINTTTHIEWSLTYLGEPMLSPVFESYAQCVLFIAAAPVDQRDDYRIISRVVVTEKSDWQEWK